MSNTSFEYVLNAVLNICGAQTRHQKILEVYDSTQLVAFIVELEVFFCIEISASDLNHDNFSTPEKISIYINHKLNKI